MSFNPCESTDHSTGNVCFFKSGTVYPVGTGFSLQWSPLLPRLGTISFKVWKPKFFAMLTFASHLDINELLFEQVFKSLYSSHV